MNNFWLKLNKPILALAPMAGYTDSAFRQLTKEYKADIVYSEMISVDAICFNNQKTLNMLKHTNQEYPLVFQLFGNDPKKFIKAVKIINAQMKNKKIGIDINLGCPAHKVTKTGSGASLMNETDKAYQIIKAVCHTSNFPVSIKIRTKVKNVTALESVKKIKDLPWTALMIHGRTLTQGFSGNIDYSTIKKIKQLLPDKIVIANGGINDLATAQATLKKTQADGLGIARGSWGKPYIFKEIKTNQEIKITPSQRKKIMIKHAQLFLENNHNLIPLRKHLIHYVKGSKNATHLRQRLIKVTTLKDLQAIL